MSLPHSGQMDQNWDQIPCLCFLSASCISFHDGESVCIGFCPTTRSPTWMMRSVGSGWPQQAFKIRRQTINLCIFLSLSLQSFLLDILSSHFQLTFLSDCYFSFILLQFFFFHFSLQSSKKTPITVSFISAFPTLGLFPEWPFSC